MRTYRAAIVGCSRAGALGDAETPDLANASPAADHAASYATCPATELVACCDEHEAVLRSFADAHDVPADHRYRDHRELLQRESPDIVSVTAELEKRAEIVIAAVKRGAKAMLAEAPLAASLGEAQAVAAACRTHDAILNLATAPRWDPGYDTLRELIRSGDIGDLQSVVTYETGALSHSVGQWLDLMLLLNDDERALWVQGHLRNGDGGPSGGAVPEDARAEAIVQFANGVTGYALLSGEYGELEAICTDGAVSALSGGTEWYLRKRESADAGAEMFRDAEFPRFEPASAPLRMVEDLVNAMESGAAPRRGIDTALAATELIFALVESHLRGGVRVDLPLEKSAARLTPGSSSSERHHP